MRSRLIIPSPYGRVKPERHMTNSFLAFIGVAILVAVTPGPETALTIRSAVIRLASFCAVVVAKGGDFPIMRLALEGATGAVFIALGLKLAADQR